MAVARKLNIRWSRTGNDLAQITVNFDVQNPDQEDDVEALFDTLWDDLKDSYTSDTALHEYRWYFASTFQPPLGDADRVVSRNVSGLSFSNGLPPQVAVVVSFLVQPSFRRHRGRIYMPAPCAAACDPDGMITSAFQGEVSNAWLAFLNACSDLTYAPVIVPKSNPGSGVFPVVRVQVDNSFDTIRRRKVEATSTSGGDLG